MRLRVVAMEIEVALQVALRTLDWSTLNQSKVHARETLSMLRLPKLLHTI